MKSGAYLSPNLLSIGAQRVATIVNKTRDGAQVEAGHLADLQDVLELLIPQMLSNEYQGWDRESIDGFNFALATRTSLASFVGYGTCILISDQSVTPFFVAIGLNAHSRQIETITAKVGESGGGELGISGPGCQSAAAIDLLAGIAARLDSIQWIYEGEYKALD